MRTKTYAFAVIQILLLFAMAENSMAKCPDRYVSVGTRCYHFSEQERITWHQAYFTCKFDLNGSLVEIENQEEQNNLRQYIETVVDPAGKYAFWIGASDQLQENEFRWMSSGNLVTFSSWFRSSGFSSLWFIVQPNNLTGDEDCVAIFKGFDYMWDDIGCTTTTNIIIPPLRAICETAPN